MITRLLVLALVLLAMSGCSTTQSGGSASRSSSGRARCLVDPNEGHTRPLVYLLCIESP